MDPPPPKSPGFVPPTAVPKAMSAELKRFVTHLSTEGSKSPIGSPPSHPRRRTTINNGAGGGAGGEDGKSEQVRQSSVSSLGSQTAAPINRGKQMEAANTKYKSQLMDMVNGLGAAAKSDRFHTKTPELRRRRRRQQRQGKHTAVVTDAKLDSKSGKEGDEEEEAAVEEVVPEPEEDKFTFQSIGYVPEVAWRQELVRVAKYWAFAALFMLWGVFRVHQGKGQHSNSGDQSQKETNTNVMLFIGLALFLCPLVQLLFMALAAWLRQSRYIDITYVYFYVRLEKGFATFAWLCVLYGLWTYEYEVLIDNNNYTPLKQFGQDVILVLIAHRVLWVCKDIIVLQVAYDHMWRPNLHMMRSSIFAQYVTVLLCDWAAAGVIQKDKEEQLKMLTFAQRKEGDNGNFYSGVDRHSDSDEEMSLYAITRAISFVPDGNVEAARTRVSDSTPILNGVRGGGGGGGKVTSSSTGHNSNENIRPDSWKFLEAFARDLFHGLFRADDAYQQRMAEDLAAYMHEGEEGEEGGGGGGGQTKAGGSMNKKARSTIYMYMNNLTMGAVGGAGAGNPMNGGNDQPLGGGGENGGGGGGDSIPPHNKPSTRSNLLGLWDEPPPPPAQTPTPALDSALTVTARPNPNPDPYAHRASGTNESVPSGGGGDTRGGGGGSGGGGGGGSGGGGSSSGGGGVAGPNRYGYEQQQQQNEDIERGLTGLGQQREVASHGEVARHADDSVVSVRAGADGLDQDQKEAEEEEEVGLGGTRRREAAAGGGGGGSGGGGGGSGAGGGGGGRLTRKLGGPGAYDYEAGCPVGYENESGISSLGSMGGGGGGGGKGVSRGRGRGGGSVGVSRGPVRRRRRSASGGSEPIMEGDEAYEDEEEEEEEDEEDEDQSLTLTLDMLCVPMTAKLARSVLELLGATEGYKELSEAQFVAGIIRLYQLRKNISRTLQDYEVILKKLGTVIACVFGFCLLLFLLVIFGGELLANGYTILTLIVALSFAFASSAQKFCESCLFVFVTHAYDVGDRIHFLDYEGKDAEVVVQKINLLSTVFRRWNGQYITIPNHSMAEKEIRNERRSDRAKAVLQLQVSATTPSSAILELREGLREWAASATARKEGICIIPSSIAVNYRSLPNAAQLILAVGYEQSQSFQNLSVKFQNNDGLTKQMVLLCKELGISFSTPTQPVVLARDDGGNSSNSKWLEGEPTDTFGPE